MAGVRPRGCDPVLCAAAARGGFYQGEPSENHRRQHRLALPRRAQTRAEGLSMRRPLLLALALLVSPALTVAHEAQDGKRLPVIGPAPSFALTSQDGAPVTLAALRGKIVAVSFIYTQCPDICPLLIQKMVQVQGELGADFGAKIAFVSITLDPEHDTPEVLKDYAQFWGTKPEGWTFLTGSPEAVRDVTRRYAVFVAKNANGSVDHTQLTSIIDAESAMRVQYLGARFDPEEFRRDLLSLLHRP